MPNEKSPQFRCAARRVDRSYGMNARCDLEANHASKHSAVIGHGHVETWTGEIFDTTPLPPIGARFLKKTDHGHRIWELKALNEKRVPESGLDVSHRLELIEETGVPPSQKGYGVGHIMHIESAWFVERTDMKRIR